MNDQIDMARFPPTGDRDTWVRYGPDGPGAQVNDFAGRDLADHEHSAATAGADCASCGFPCWPDGSPA